MIRDKSPSMMQAYNAAGAAFADAILRTLFGFQPPPPFGKRGNDTGAALFEPAMSRGFDGALSNLAWRGREWQLSSDKAAGLAVRETRAV